MTTHVDGAVPSVAPDPGDGNPDDGILDDGGPGRHPSEFDDGSHWVRAEIQRRMAENRSTRGRHARRGEAAAGQPDGLGSREASQGRRRKPVAPTRLPPPPPVPPPGSVAAGDLPENYVPRHSVLTPGPAAEPAAPISGPIPVVRPVADDATTGTAAAEAPNTIETRSAPVGGPSLPPTGIPLPVRKRRTGPGVPLHGDGTAAGPWSRPGSSIVPDQPVQRLGAPPGVPGGPTPCRRGAFRPPRRTGSRPRHAAPAEVAPRPDTGPAETSTPRTPPTTTSSLPAPGSCSRSTTPTTPTTTMTTTRTTTGTTTTAMSTRTRTTPTTTRAPSTRATSTRLPTPSTRQAPTSPRRPPPCCR